MRIWMHVNGFIFTFLQDPIGSRRHKLTDALRLQQFFRDVEDEEDWIREKEPIVASTNRGKHSWWSQLSVI